MKNICGPASKTYDSLEKLKETITNTKEVIVLGIFKKESPEDSIQKKFNKVADILRERANFANVFTDSVSGVYKIKLLKGLKEKSSNVILIRPQHLRNKFENDYEVYSSGEMRDFIRSNYHGLVGHRTIDNRLDFNVCLNESKIYHKLNQILISIF
jgi:protein disulfide isomerase family A protein 3